MTHVIAIDGPAGSGKSSVSRELAKRLSYAYLDTGAMYRAVAVAAKRRRIDMKDEEALGNLCAVLDITLVSRGSVPGILLGEEDISVEIRSPEMDMLSSAVSAVPSVRQGMTVLQRRMARRYEGVVAEGRDMGTVVFPDAKDKFFLTAAVEVRAERRYRERLERGERPSSLRVKEEMKKRDAQDENRAAAPLRAASDAVIIDSTNLSIDGVIGIILDHIRKN
ncbi:MAG: (d)CMP kinase [Deltaproteobacteria bacterium]|nr:(d)CMP kinase [Deltaproteobacteria bacterium]